MARTWPSARFWRRVAIATVTLIVAMMTILRLFAMTPMARDMVESRLEAITVRGQTFELEGLKGDLLGRLSVDRLNVRDADGIWLTADDIALNWSPLAYLSQHLKIKDISAKELIFLRRPLLAPSSGGGTGPERITLEALEIATVSLEDGVAGPAQSYALTARLETQRPTGGFEIHLLPRTQDGDRIQASLDWGGDIPLRGRMEISGAPNGLIATLVQSRAGEPVPPL